MQAANLRVSPPAAMVPTVGIVTAHQYQDCCQWPCWFDAQVASGCAGVPPGPRFGYGLNLTLATCSSLRRDVWVNSIRESIRV
jgi:hypothetical protein